MHSKSRTSKRSGKQHRYRLLCVDDHPDITQMVAKMACEGPDAEFECVGQLICATDLLDEIKRLESRSQCPDLIVLDLVMPGLNPLTALEQVTALCPRIKVIAYSGHELAMTAKLAIEAGAMGYVPKAGDPWEIIRALRVVAGGGTYFNPV